MRNVPNDIVQTLIRNLPVILDNVDLTKSSNRLYNAVRLVRKIVKRLNNIEDEQKNQN